MADFHSEILDHFEAGWNALGAERQQKWLESTHPYGKIWESWAEVLAGQMEDEIGGDLPQHYYNQTPLTTLRNKIADFTCPKLPHSGSLFGLSNIPGTPDVRDRVSKVAATIILRNATAGIIKWLEKEIEKGGVDALRKIVFGNKEVMPAQPNIAL
jgi:hypothetical protein